MMKLSSFTFIRPRGRRVRTATFRIEDTPTVLALDALVRRCSQNPPTEAYCFGQHTPFAAMQM